MCYDFGIVFLLHYLRRFFDSLLSVTAVDVGRSGDGLVQLSAGSEFDRTYDQLLGEFNDAREAFRKSPLARRIVTLVTAYVLGGSGIRLRGSGSAGFNRFVESFVNHPENRLILREEDLSNELSRSGELFIALFWDWSGVPVLRPIPASRIARVVTRDGDYEHVLKFVEAGVGVEDGREWFGWRHPVFLERREHGDRVPPMLLHYAVNRMVGNVRGESDLASILPWIRRYSRFVEDRVILNAASRAWLWIVRVPRNKVAEIAAKYRKPPAPGSVLVVERESEEWEVKAANLNARDAANDARLLRWMIVAGGPGTGLTDIGEAETSNLATASAMSEQRRRYLRQRQAYFGWMLADVVVQAWNYGVRIGARRGRLATVADVVVDLPDVAPADNQLLAASALRIVRALKELREIVGDSEALRRLSVELVVKFAGEFVSDDVVQTLISEGVFCNEESDPAA